MALLADARSNANAFTRYWLKFVPHDIRTCRLGKIRDKTFPRRELGFAYNTLGLGTYTFEEN